MEAKAKSAFTNYFKSIIDEEIKTLGLEKIVVENITEEDASDLFQEVDGKGLDESTIVARFKKQYGIWLTDPHDRNAEIEPESFKDVDELCDPVTAKKIKAFFGNTKPYQFEYSGK